MTIIKNQRHQRNRPQEQQPILQVQQPMIQQIHPQVRNRERPADDEILNNHLWNQLRRAKLRNMYWVHLQGVTLLHYFIEHLPRL